MRRKKIRNTLLLSMLIIVTIVSGCQSAQMDKKKQSKFKDAAVEMSDSDEYILGEDGCNTLSYLDCESIIVPSENGYYFIQSGMFCFFDKETNRVDAYKKPYVPFDLDLIYTAIRKKFS